MNTTLRPDLARRLVFGAVLLGSLVTATAHPAGQSLTAVLTYPVNGATDVDLSQPIRWTSVANVQAYYLYVGTTVGAKDLINTGEIQATSYLVTKTLPAGQTLYVRLNTKVGGAWRYTDSTFRARILVAASITYPANGAINFDVSQPIRWTTVANVQAYYLYVGTTAGAKDLVNTGEIQPTSYRVTRTLPVNQPLYARIHTKVSGLWRYTDSTFITPSPPATITYPANGATNADLTQSIQWTTVVNAQAYFLYIGTTVGTRDLVSTGEIQQTSYRVTKTLPANQTLYARLNTKVNGVWRYIDSTFSAASMTPTITYPANGAIAANLSQPIQWTSVLSAQAYYLYLGTTVGAQNLVSSGELLQTSYVVPKNLPANQTLFARIFAKVGGVWRYRDSVFSAAPLTATLIYPANGAVNVDRARLATWTSVPNAEAYYLYVGSTQGANDVLADSRETRDTSYSIATVPTGRVLFARLHTKLGGVWRYVDSTFTATPLAAELLYPLDGATNVDLGQPFRWTAAIGAEAYKLSIGTTPGGADIADSGDTANTSYPATGLPSSGILYARVWTKVNGSWTRHSDIMFSPEARTDVSRIVTPVDGTTHFNTLQPFQWSAVAIARAYRLMIGSAPGGSDLHDSGEIGVTQRFVPNLPLGVPLFGRLETKIDGVWTASDFTFQVIGNAVSQVNQIKSALWATNFVRQMASDDGRPYGWTELMKRVEPRYSAVPTDYAYALLYVLGEVNLLMPARPVRVAFNSTPSDLHTLVEVQDPLSLRWVMVDPTFSVVARRSDGTWATADDISAATLASNWSAISYVFLGTDDAYARSNDLDYPLLFLNVYHEGQLFVQGAGRSPLPYLQPVSLPADGARAFYMIQCTAAAFADVVIDGAMVRVNCDGAESSSAVFPASTVAAPAGSPAFVLGRVMRFVF